VNRSQERSLGASWQHCRVHFRRKAQDLVPARPGAWSQPPSAQIFEQPDEASARAQLRRVVDGLEARLPTVASLLMGAEADLLFYFNFPNGPPSPDPQHKPARAAQ
jgi:putative transposase